MKSIEIDGIRYVPESELANNPEGLPFVIARTYSAGVRAGYLAKQDGQEVLLFDSRTLWRWEGAFTLSKLATDGTSKPDDCKFSCVTKKVHLTQCIEILYCEEKAKESILGVPDHEC